MSHGEKKSVYMMEPRLNRDAIPLGFSAYDTADRAEKCADFTPCLPESPKLWVIGDDWFLPPNRGGGRGRRGGWKLPTELR